MQTDNPRNFKTMAYVTIIATMITAIATILAGPLGVRIWDKIYGEGEGKGEGVKRYVIHKVKEGETLSEIAERYKISIATIVDDNNLKKEPVYISVRERKYKTVNGRKYYKTVTVRKLDRYDYLVKEGQQLKIST